MSEPEFKPNEAQLRFMNESEPRHTLYPGSGTSASDPTLSLWLFKSLGGEFPESSKEPKGEKQ